MNMYTKIALGLLASVLTAGTAPAANHMDKMHDQNPCKEGEGMSMMQGQMKGDPVARAQKKLSELESSLKLTNEQQPAWKKFSAEVNKQAQNMASRKNAMMNEKSDMTMDAPDRISMMADMMKERAQTMAAMADAVKAFYAELTPEQKGTFDKMHMQQMKSMHH